MRFQLSNKNPRFLNRQFQARMIVAVVMFGLFLWLVETWRFSSLKVTSSPADPARNLEADYSIKEDPPLRDDEFRVSSTPVLPEDEQRVSAADVGVALPTGWLDGVRDNTLGIRRDEGDSFFRVLAHARDVPASDLQRAARKDVLYINLMAESERFRGEVVTVTGEMWRLREFAAAENSYGLRKLYEAWIFTDDSSTHPYRVVCTSLPKGMEPGQNLRTPVRVVGYFFKREGYESPGGLHVAPTILAKRLQWYSSPNAPPPMESLSTYLLGIVGAVSLALVATLVAFTLSDQKAEREDLRRMQAARLEKMPDLQQADYVDVGSMLENLSVQLEREVPRRPSQRSDELAPPSLHVLSRPSVEDDDE